MNRLRHWMPGLLTSLVMAGFIVVAGCTHPVRRLVFQPHHIAMIPPFPQDIPQLRRLWLDTDQGKVEGWLLQGSGGDDTHPGSAILMAHGNRELIDLYLRRAQGYQRRGFTVLLGEYRGYGRSAGAPTRQRIASDFRRFYDLLKAQPNVDAASIVFHGRSLGGAVLSELSRQRPPAAVIVESTFTSIKAMAHGAPDWLLTDNYDTLSALSSYPGPILIIHGTEDQVVPVAHALELKAHLRDAQLLLYDCGHSDCPPDWDVYWNDIMGFLERYVPQLK